MSEIGRRSFLSASAGAALAQSRSGLFGQSARPNVLLIIVDQMHAGMLSCSGNPWVKTPALDSIARGGARFERAYCANPVCVPSRFAMMTGAMPSRMGVEENGDSRKTVPPDVMAHTLGRVFAASGYETVYGGKVHLPETNDTKVYGFERFMTNDQKDQLADKCVGYFKSARQRPFLMVASFINPHDICFLAIDAHAKTKGEGRKVGLDLQNALALPAGVSREEFFARRCPPLPANYAIPKHEPDALLSVDDREFRHYVRDHWTEQDWRMHRWAYARLTERVDAEIGLLLKGLTDAGLDKNTLVAVVADHGDMDSAHRLEHKSVLYEESVRVPFVVRLPGVVRAGVTDKEHLVSTGIDLLPSLCDLAGLTRPAGLYGRSIRPLVTGQPVSDWRTSLVVETLNARAVYSGKRKYIVYGSGKLREQVTDLTTDPGEMRNLAVEPAAAAQVKLGRRALKDWYAANGEKLDPRYIVSE